MHIIFVLFCLVKYHFLQLCVYKKKWKRIYVVYSCIVAADRRPGEIEKIEDEYFKKMYEQWKGVKAKDNDATYKVIPKFYFKVLHSLAHSSHTYWDEILKNALHSYCVLLFTLSRFSYRKRMRFCRRSYARKHELYSCKGGPGNCWITTSSKHCGFCWTSTTARLCQETTN